MFISATHDVTIKMNIEIPDEIMVKYIGAEQLFSPELPCLWDLLERITRVWTFLSSLIGICVTQDQYQLFYLDYRANGKLVITPILD